MIAAFTSCAPNYTGKALALFESLRQFCPSVENHWLFIDRRRPEPVSWAGDLVDRIWFVDDLGPGRDPAWVFAHDLVELSTALKPFFARELLRSCSADVVLYFDPDIVVFSPLDDLLDVARKSPVVLTPHLLQPEQSSKAILDNELCALRNGLYNLGFFAASNSPEGFRFLDWWCSRCELLCTEDTSSGAFTDQKWIDLAPLFFPSIYIERSPRFNVAPWNISQRQLTGTFDTGFQVDGEPLGFYHFTGFDSGAHQMVVDWYGRGCHSVHMLVDWYGLRSRFLAPRTDDGVWQLGHYANGWKVMPEHRRIYRNRLDLQRAFPTPLEVDPPPSYVAWLQAEGCFGQPEWSRSGVR